MFRTEYNMEKLHIYARFSATRHVASIFFFYFCTLESDFRSRPPRFV